jgi:hypothetical protein
MIKKYYFENTNLDKIYSTLWNGEFIYNGDKIPLSLDYHQESNRELDDILTENLDVNFYVSLIDNNIHISCCSDFKFYFYDFEKYIKRTILNIESKFNIYIYFGNFNATEIKHNGNQYKYTINKNNENKIILKKRILNWEVLESKKKKISENILNDFNNLKI